MPRGRPPGSIVKTRVAWGDVPEVGDELRFPSGRRYLVLYVRKRALRCLVLPEDEPVTGRVLEWRWASRARRRT